MEFDKRKTIRSSEIGQHEYCSIAWYLQRCGFKPDSKLLDKGSKVHVELGNKITTALSLERKSKTALYFGLGLIAVTIVLIAWLLL